MYRITCRRSRYSASRIRVPATACRCRLRGSCGRWRGAHPVDSTRCLPWPNPWNGSRWASSFASSRSRATESRVARPGRSRARNAWPSNGTDVLPGRAPEITFSGKRAGRRSTSSMTTSQRSGDRVSSGSDGSGAAGQVPHPQPIGGKRLPASRTDHQVAAVYFDSPVAVLRSRTRAPFSTSAGCSSLHDTRAHTAARVKPAAASPPSTAPSRSRDRQP